MGIENSNAASFIELVAKVRGGDQDSAAELVRRYEPHVRRVIRVRLTNSGLRRQLDSMDLCQSVLGDFFARATDGQFAIEEPEQLIALLAAMARHKLINHIEKQRAAKRDIGRLEAGDVAELPVAGGDATPSRIVEGRDLLARVRERLTPDERYLAEQRALGRDWAELAVELSERPDAIRMRLKRAMDRVARELGIDQGDDI